MPNKKLREKRRRYLELSRASAAAEEEADPSTIQQSSEDVRHDDGTAADTTAIPVRGSRFKEELPVADAPLSDQGRSKEDPPAADEDGPHSLDIGLCIFAPRVAKEIEQRNVFQFEQMWSPREPQIERRGERTLSQEQMPPPPRPRDIQPSRINKRRRRNDKSQSESTGFSRVKVAIAPRPKDPQLSHTNSELDSQVKSSRHRRIQAQVRRNLGLDQTNSKEDESNRAKDLPEPSTAWLPGLMELCNAAYINMILKDPCPGMIARAQEPGTPPDQTLPSTPLDSRAAGMQPFEESSPGQQSYSRGHQTGTAIDPPSPPLEPASFSTQEKTFFLDELLHFYQVRELHTINAGPATLYSCATHDTKVEGAILAYPSFILLHAGRKYPEWPSLFFSSTDDTEEEFGCIHSLPRVHKGKQFNAVPVFKEVTWLVRELPPEDLEESDREKRSNPTATGSASEGVAPPTQNPGTVHSTNSGKRAETAKDSKVFYPVLSEDSNDITNERDLDQACREQFLEGRRAKFLGWYDILGVRYHERTPQALHDRLQRMLRGFRNGERIHPLPPKGSATQQVSAKVVENYKGLFGCKGEVWKEGQMPPEGPTADANPMERSFAATPGRMSPPLQPPLWSWDPFCLGSRTKVFELSKYLEAHMSAESASPPPPSPPPSCQQSGNPELPIPFTAHIKEKDYWTLIWGEAFVNVTLAPAGPKSLGRVVDRHGEEALTNPLTLGYKSSVTVAEDGLSCAIEGTDVPDGDAVYDTLGRRVEKACAVRSNHGSGSGGSGGRSSGSPGPDGRVRVERDDFGNPYAGTEYRRRRGIKKRWPRSWGREDGSDYGGDDPIDRVAVGESSADKNMEDHHDSDNDEPDTTANKEKGSSPTESPVPPPFTYHPSMTFTVPATTTTSPGIETLGVTKVQRIIRQACHRDLHHIHGILRAMCRQQVHRQTVERHKIQQHPPVKRQTQRQISRLDRRHLAYLRGMMASGEVEATMTGAREATERLRDGVCGRGSAELPGGGGG